MDEMSNVIAGMWVIAAALFLVAGLLYWRGEE